jgi:hypothetical protein
MPASYEPGARDPWVPKKNSTFSQVTQALRAEQRSLKSKGYYTGQVDGLWGPKTEAAFKRAIQAETQRLRLHQNAGDLRHTEYLNLLAKWFTGHPFAAVASPKVAGNIFAGARGAARNEQAAYERQLASFRAQAKRKEEEYRNSLRGKLLAGVENLSKNAVVGGAINAISAPVERAVMNPYYAWQFAENERLRQGKSFGLGKRLSTFGASLGLGRFVDKESRGYALATNSPEERQALRKAGRLESFGERMVRSFDQSVLQAESLLSLDPGDKRRAKERLAAQQGARDFRAFGQREDYGNLLPVKLVDLSLQVFGDPLNYAAGLGAIGHIDDVIKASRFLKGAAAEGVLEQVARAAAKAAERATGPELGDARFLTRLVPSLKDKTAAPLVGALVSRSADDVVQFLREQFTRAVVSDANDLVKAGLSPEAAKAAVERGAGLVRQAENLATRVAREGVTAESRKELLRLSLGILWKPTIKPLALAASKAPDTRVVRGLLAVPGGLRLAKGESWVHAFAQATRGKEAGFLGSVTDPTEKSALEFVKRSSAEVKSAAGLARSRQAKPLMELLQLMGKDASKMPDEFRGVYLQRTAGLAQRFKDEMGVDLSPDLPKLKSVPGLSKGLAKDIRALNRDLAGVRKLNKYGREQMLHNFNVELRDYEFASGKLPKARYNPWQKIWIPAARTFNDVPTSQINLHNVAERAKTFHDWTLAMNGTMAEAEQAYSRMTRPMTLEQAVKEAKSIQEGVIDLALARAGLDEDQVNRLAEHIATEGKQFLREYQGWASVLDARARRYKDKWDRIYDINEAKSAQVLSQMQYNLPMVDPQDVRNAARLMRHLENRTTWTTLQQAAHLTGSAITIGYRPLHQAFKYLALVAGAPRYILRVAVMDERQRMWDFHGFKSFVQVRGKHTRKLNARTLDETGGLRWATGWEEIGIDGLPMHLMDKKGIEVSGYGLLKKGEKGHAESAWHILMFQVRPEDDIVQSVLIDILHLPNEDEALEVARESIKNILETSKNGREYLERAIRLNKKNKNLDYLIDNTHRWMKEVMPNREVVDARIRGKFSLKRYKENADWQPDVTWGEKYSNMWVGGFTDKGKSWVKLAGRLTIESPTTTLNRQPFFWAEFNKEWDALVTAGLDPKRANEIANAHAIRRTNEILFDARVKSRFAQKLDPFFPFQQAREEVVRVTARTLKENPTRVAQRVRLLALAFNNGVNNGVITKNHFGDWEMKVPGSAALSRALANWAPSWLPFTDGLREVADSDYSFNLKDLLFVNDAWGIVPRPSGPWWSTLGNGLARLNPEFVDGPFDSSRMQGLWQEYFFGFGTNMRLVPRPEITKLYMALTGDDHPFWEPFASKSIGKYAEPELQQLRDKLTGEVYAELVRQYVQAGKDPTTITPEEVSRAVNAQLAVHSLIGLFFPASTRVAQQGEDEYQTLVKKYTVDGQVDWQALTLNHPEMAGYAVFNTWDDRLRQAYTDASGDVDVEKLRAENPQYWDTWSKRRHGEETQQERLKAGLILARDYKNAGDMKDVIDQAIQNNRAFKELNHMKLAVQSGWVRPGEAEAWFGRWEQEHGDRLEAQGVRLNAYRKRTELDTIWNATKWNAEERRTALENWQYKYNVSDRERKRLEADAEKGIDHRNVWMEARNGVELRDFYTKQNTRGLSPIRWANEYLSPAERIKFFRVLGETTEDYQDYADLKAEIGKVQRKYGDMLYKKGKGKLYKTIEQVSEEYWRDKEGDAFEDMGRRYDQINALTKQIDAVSAQIGAKIEAAKAAKKFDSSVGPSIELFHSLRDRRNRLFAEIKGIKNGLYRKVPRLESVEEELKFLHLATDGGWEKGKTRLDKEGIPYFDSFEERAFDGMPPHVQQDYVDTLLEQLTLPPGQYRTEDGASRLKWSYLTEFQTDLLRGHISPKQVDLIKRLDRQDSEFNKRGRGGWNIDGHKLGSGFGELAYAFEMFKQYNRRGDMPEPTKELAEYKALGDNAILKRQYIRDHPNLAEWFRKGPMQQMPPALAMVIRNIMVKYGKWDTDDRTYTYDELAELGFAKTMLAKYNRRKGDAPAAYELWVKMPTGSARFKYMQAHPEIEAWLQAGPMANMPQEYQEVVRDIMTRYGEWDARTDPLSELITQYFETPSYAKQDFLEAHPEIMAYWRAIRSGRERVLFDMAMAYFALKTPEQKKAYIAAYPEVQEYFIEERKRRYQSFLGQVARYLGKMPELAEEYLADQTRFIKELLDKFGQRPLVAPTATVAASREVTGRRSRAEGRMRG